MAESAWYGRASVVCWVLLSAYSRGASAEPADGAQECPEQTAQALAAEGIELAENDRLVAALEKFHAALACRPHRDIHYNIAQVLTVLGQPVEAREALRRYLVEAQGEITAEDEQAAERDLQRIEAQIAGLTITAHPPVARVYVDGKQVTATDQPGPLPLRVGRHGLAVELEGYETVRRTITLQSGEHQEVDVRLEPVASGSFALQVECSLPDVSVEVNDRVVGRTPLGLVGVPERTARVQLTRAGYRGRQLEVAGGASQLAHVDCSLEPIEPLAPGHSAHLVVVPSVPDADVWVDGRAGRSSDLPLGAHFVEVRRPGYVTVAETLELGAGWAEHRVQLVPEPWYESELRSRAAGTLRPRQLWGVGLAASGVALGLASLVTWRVNAGEFGRWQREDDRLFDSDVPPPDWERRVATNNQRARTIEQLSTLSTGLGIAAGGLMASGLVLVLWPPLRRAAPVEVVGRVYDGGGFASARWRW